MKKTLVLLPLGIFICLGLGIFAFAEEGPAYTQEQPQGHIKELLWQANSKAMFAKVVQSAPAFVRPLSEQRLMKALMARSAESRIVTEAMVIECTKAVTPAPFIEQALRELLPLMSK